MDVQRRLAQMQEHGRLKVTVIGRRGFLSMLFAAYLVQACDADPTPGQIARCRTDASVSLPQATKVRSLRLDRSALDVSRCNTACYNLLRDRQLDFVELRREGGPEHLVDRLRLAPAGSSICAPPFRQSPDNWPPQRYQFRAPKGQCIVIEEGQAPKAEAKLQERRIPSESHEATVREAVSSDGALLARVLDYRTNYVEVSDVTCADVIRGFPRNTYELIISHVTGAR